MSFHLNTTLSRILAPSLLLGLSMTLLPGAELDARTTLPPANTIAMDEQLARLSSHEAAFLTDLAEWMDESDTNMREAYRDRRDSFELFRTFHDPATRTSVLAEVPYGTAIEKAAEDHGVDSLLVASVVEVESNFRPTVGSNKGAVGLMQLLPSTAGMSRAKLKNPDTNLDAGARYLAYLIERFDGDLELALAAYNAGPTNVRRYDGVPPFPETENYVQKVLSRYADHHRTVWEQQDPELRKALVEA